jgi:hypothetical protein
MVLSRGHVDLGHTGRMRRSEARHIDGAVVRVRIGIALWLVSWIPFGVIFRLNGRAFLVAIAVEIIMGLKDCAPVGTLPVGTQARVSPRDLSNHTSPTAWFRSIS